MIDASTERGARVAARLRDELILWLTTVTPAGQPQASPVWFLLDGEDLLVYSRLDSPRLRNLRANPLVAANLDDDGRGDDVVTIEGEARIVTERTEPSEVPPAYVTKYAELLAANGWTIATMLPDYPVTLRVRITRVRAW